jgi:small redox-active disulfide protein 2
MSIFRKKQSATTSACSCGGACCVTAPTAKETSAAIKDTTSTEASVKVLGSGCAKCNALEAATKEALEELGMDTTIDHVTDFTQIAKYGVMSTPALVIDNKVVSMGKVLKKDDVVSFLHKARD